MLQCINFYDAYAKESAVSFQYQGFEAATGIEPERVLNIGVGVAQAPLWAAFYASAGLGAAWWWSTAWTRAVPSLDFARLAEPESQPAVEAFLPAPEAAADEVIEAAREEAAEAVEIADTVEAGAEASIEIAGETAVESVSYAVEQVEAAIAETTDVAPDAPAPLEAASEVAAEAAEKASKKKAPKAD